MIKKESVIQAKKAYEIESKCIEDMLKYFDEKAFSDAVEPGIRLGTFEPIGGSRNTVLSLKHREIVKIIARIARLSFVNS